MLSIERVRELLNDPSLSDAEVEQSRDECRILVEIIFEKWKEERIKAKAQKDGERPDPPPQGQKK